MNLSRRLLMKSIGYLACFTIFTKKASSALNNPVEARQKIKDTMMVGPLSTSKIQCSCLDDFYGISSNSTEHVINLQRLIKNGPLINTQLLYDKDDSISSDDGYSVFVSHDNSRWKADVSNGIDVRLAGLLQDGSNLGSCVNKIVTGEIAKIKAGKSLFECITTIFIPAKFNGRDNPNYILDESITIPSFFSLKTNGLVYISVPASLKYALKITNDILHFSTNTLLSSPTDIQGCNPFEAGGGRFVFSGAENNNVTTGLYIGNQRPNRFAVRDLLIKDVTLQYFNAGIEFAPNNNFINTFDKINILMCKYGFWVKAYKSINSGEKIIFDNCVFGNNQVAHFYLGAQISYYINNCSLDYTGEYVFYISETSALSRLLIDKGHIEGVPKYLVYCPEKLPLPLKIQFRDVMLYINGAPYNSMRQLVFSPEGKCHIIFDGCDWTFTNYYENSPYISLVGYNDGTEVNNRVVINNPLPRVTGLRSNSILSQYKNSLLGDNCIARGVKGTSLLNRYDHQSNILFISETPDVEVVYGDIDDDESQIIEIVSNSNDTIVDLVSRFSHHGSMSSLWSGGCSIELADVITKKCNMNFIVDLFQKPYISIGNADENNRLRKELFESYISDNIDLIKVFSSAKGTENNSGFIGVWQSVTQNKYAGTCLPKIRFQNFMGKLRIKLPVFWRQ